jgi:alpha-mannosidase
VGGEQIGFLVETAANPAILGGGFVPTPLGDKRTAGDTPLYRLTRADLAVLDEQVWHLVLDLDVLTELMHQLVLTDPRRHEILRAVERALDAVDLDDVPGTATAARVELAPALSRPAQASAHRISAVGHAHIDSAWLWPVRETIRKTARTFANVTALARDYPELVFACSQAQQYAWLKPHQPDIYRRMQEAAKAGQWAPVGGMWVETDGNLPGGESLARQFATGKRFFLEEFGVECGACGCPTRLATARRTRSWPSSPECGGSSPRRSRGTRPTNSRTTHSGGKASTAAGSSPTSRRPLPTTAP